MKKVLLSSVAALAVFAAAAPAFAADDISNHVGAQKVLGSGYVDTDMPANFAEANQFTIKAQEASSKAKTAKANNATVEPKKDAKGNVIPNEFVVKDKAGKAAGKDAAKPGAAKASAAAGQKALPKTSAAK